MRRAFGVLALVALVGCSDGGDDALTTSTTTTSTIEMQVRVRGTGPIAFTQTANDPECTFAGDPRVEVHDADGRPVGAEDLTYGAAYRDSTLGAGLTCIVDLTFEVGRSDFYEITSEGDYRIDLFDATYEWDERLTVSSEEAESVIVFPIEAAERSPFG